MYGTSLASSTCVEHLASPPPAALCASCDERTYRCRCSIPPLQPLPAAPHLLPARSLPPPVADLHDNRSRRHITEQQQQYRKAGIVFELVVGLLRLMEFTTTHLAEGGFLGRTSAAGLNLNRWGPRGNWLRVTRQCPVGHLVTCCRHTGTNSPMLRLAPPFAVAASDQAKVRPISPNDIVSASAIRARCPLAPNSVIHLRFLLSSCPTSCNHFPPPPGCWRWCRSCCPTSQRAATRAA